MKWNCNIVKDMYDRVLRRKFGILCKDDTSNEDFIKSYLNRLDCTPIDLSCLKGSNLPCTSDGASSTIVCNAIVIINVSEKEVDGEIHYTFTAVSTGTTPPISYAWSWDNLAGWNYVSGPALPGVYYTNANVLVLKPKQLSGTVSTTVSVAIKDSVGCSDEIGIAIVYKGGCTDPDAANYDPDATFDNGSCYYEPLLPIINFTCEEDDTATFCVTAVGGNPPYTVVGTPNGTIATNGGTLCQNFPNNSTYSFYIIDSAGVVSRASTGLLVCPFDCMFADIKPNEIITCLTDAFGNNTGQATITIVPSGGNAPYTITGSINGIPGFTNGQVVNDKDEITVLITDVNGCTFTDTYEIDCPLPDPGGSGVTCEDLKELNISASLNITDANFSILSGHTDYEYFFSYQFTNLASFGLTTANIALVQFTVIPDPGYLLNYRKFTGPGSPCTVCTGNLIPIHNPGTVPQYVNPAFNDPANDEFVIRYAGLCIGTKTINVTLKLQVKIVTEDVTCTLCFERKLSADWNCTTSTDDSSGKLLINIPC